MSSSTNHGAPIPPPTAPPPTTAPAPAVFWRPHRGGLGEALRDARMFSTLAAALAYIEREWPTMVRGSLELAPQGDDTRIGWRNVHMVTGRAEGGRHVLGYLTVPADEATMQANHAAHGPKA